MEISPISDTSLCPFSVLGFDRIPRNPPAVMKMQNGYSLKNPYGCNSTTQRATESLVSKQDSQEFVGNAAIAIHTLRTIHSDCSAQRQDTLCIGEGP